MHFTHMQKCMYVYIIAEEIIKNMQNNINFF